MFLKELVEDFDYQDVEYVYENDKYFMYTKDRYDLTKEDEINFDKLKTSSEEFRRYSLEVVSLKKLGLLSRIELVDSEDDRRDVSSFSMEELASFPVDLYYSSNEKRAIRLIISLLLEKTYYLNMDEKNKKKDTKELGALTIDIAEIEDI